jgi:dTDP-glucose pyrophosphorylase/CBS domain-containing protein
MPRCHGGIMALDAALLVAPSASVREALETITKNSRQAVMVVAADGRLVGIVTDGDIRRGFLRGVTIDGQVGELMNRQPVTAPVGVARDEALALLQRRNLRHLPVVDASGRLVDVILFEDLLRPLPLPNAAVLMAGGDGSRLRPLTDTVPKPLLRVGGKPLLEILIERLRACGVSRFFVTVRYKSEMIEAHFGDGGRLGVRIRYVREEAPLGTAGALAELPEPLAEPFFLVNGDILTKCDFRAMLDFHGRWQADLTVGTVPHTVEVPYGVLQVDGERLAGIQEKPRLDFLVNAGVYVVGPAALPLVPRQRAVDAPELIPLLKQAGRTVVAFPIREYWLDVGQHGDFHQANQDVAEGLLD